MVKGEGESTAMGRRSPAIESRDGAGPHVIWMDGDVVGREDGAYSNGTRRRRVLGGSVIADG